MSEQFKSSHAGQLLISEARINILRAVAISALYLQHLVSFFLIRDESLSVAFHNSVNLIVVVWVCVVAMVFFMLQQNRWPIRLSYFVVFCDAFLISWLIIAAGGPTKIQTILFLLLIFVNALRLLRSIVWFGVVASVVGYLTCLCEYVFVEVGYEKYYSADGVSLRISRHDEMFMLIALLVAGVIADQIVIQTYRIARSTKKNLTTSDSTLDEGSGEPNRETNGGPEE